MPTADKSNHSAAGTLLKSGVCATAHGKAARDRQTDRQTDRETEGQTNAIVSE